VEVHAHEDAAGTEPAALRVRLLQGEAALVDERHPVSETPITTGEAPAVDTLDGAADLHAQIDYLNDAVVDGRDRNAYVDSVILRCR
jgi:hypothetical protein